MCEWRWQQVGGLRHSDSWRSVWRSRRVDRRRVQRRASWQVYQTSRVPVGHVSSLRHLRRRPHQLHRLPFRLFPPSARRSTTFSSQIPAFRRAPTTGSVCRSHLLRLLVTNVLSQLTHDLLLSPVYQHRIYSELTTHNLTPDNRDVNSVDCRKRSAMN